MAETERLVKIEILGQEHAFYTAASDEDLSSILNMVRQLVESNAGQPPGKVAILACLNLASRYVKLKQEHERLVIESDERILRMNEKIQSSLVRERGEN